MWWWAASESSPPYGSLADAQTGDVGDEVEGARALRWVGLMEHASRFHPTDYITKTIG
jgi:hypothetical protein